MRQSVFEYKDYKKFVIDWIQRSANEGRGQRKLLADAIGCQTPFITQVLSGDYHFSAEQAEASARWLGLNDEDTEYFVLLVLRQRAGTRGLESLFAKQLSERRQKASILKRRVNIEESLSTQAQAAYYSSWHYSAVHIAIMLPTCRTVDALQKTLQIPRSRVLEILEFLTQQGLIESAKGGYKVLRPLLHLEKSSPLLPQYLINWRLRAAEAVQQRSDRNLHYSGMASVSTDDFEWIRERLSLLLEEIAIRIKDSADEEAAVINLDWFTLT